MDVVEMRSKTIWICRPWESNRCFLPVTSSKQGVCTEESPRGGFYPAPLFQAFGLQQCVHTCVHVCARAAVQREERDRAHLCVSEPGTGWGSRCPTLL